MKERTHHANPNGKLHIFPSFLHSVISNPFQLIPAVMVAVLAVIIMGISAIVLFGNTYGYIEHAVWQWKIKHNEVVTTTASIVDKHISQYVITTDRKYSFNTRQFITCSFTYIYTVNGKTYTATETDGANDDSVCYHTITEIEIYYDPNDVDKSISSRLGYAGAGIK
jgi:hypothetical protein